MGWKTDVLDATRKRVEALDEKRDPSGVLRMTERRIRDLSPITQEEPLYAQYLEIAEGAREHPAVGETIAQEYGLRNDYRARKIINRPQELLIQHQQSLAQAGQEIEAGEAVDQDISALTFVPTGESAREVRQVLDISSAIESLQSGKNAEGGTLSQVETKNNIRVIDEYMLQQARESRGRTIGASVATGVAKVPAFMLEFWLSGPAAGLVKKGMSKASLAAMKKYSSSQLRNSLLTRAGGKLADRAVRKGISTGARGLSWGAQGLARTIAIPDRTVAGTLERQLPEELEVTDKGEVFIKRAGEKPFTAFTKAMGDEWIEMASEASGPALKAMLRKVPGVAKVMDAIHDPLARTWSRVTGKSVADFSRNLLKEGGFDSMLEEMGEERVGNTLRAVFGVEDFGAEDPESMISRLIGSIPSGKDMLIEAGIFAVPGAGQIGLSSVVKAKQKKKLERSAKVFKTVEAVMHNGTAVAILDAEGTPSRTVMREASGLDHKLNSIDRQLAKDVLVQLKDDTEAQVQEEIAQASGAQEAPELAPEAPQEALPEEIPADLPAQEAQEVAQEPFEGEADTLPVEEVANAQEAITEDGVGDTNTDAIVNLSSAIPQERERSFLSVLDDHQKALDFLRGNEEVAIQITDELNSLADSLNEFSGTADVLSKDRVDEVIESVVVSESEAKSNVEGTKAVDENGNPILLMHGTKGDFINFDKNYLGATTGAPSAKEGFFFTNSEETAEYYSKIGATGEKKAVDRKSSFKSVQELNKSKATVEEILRTLTNNKRIFYSSDPILNEVIRAASRVNNAYEFGSVENLTGKKIVSSGSRVLEVYLDLKNPMVVDLKGKARSNTVRFSRLIESAKKAGNDGLIIKNTFDPFASDIYVAFDSSQIELLKVRPAEKKKEKTDGEEAEAPGPRAVREEPAEAGKPEEAGEAEEEVESRREGPTGSKSLIGGFEERTKDASEILADTFSESKPLPKGLKFTERKDGLIEVSNEKGFKVTIDIVDEVSTSGMDKKAMEASAKAAGVTGELVPRARYYPAEGIIEIDEKFMFEEDVLHEELFHAGMHQIKLKKPKLYDKIMDEYGGESRSEDEVYHKHFLTLADLPLTEVDLALDTIREGKAFRRKIETTPATELKKLSSTELTERAKELGVRSVGKKAKSKAVDAILGEKRLDVDSKDWRANFKEVMEEGSVGQKMEMIEALRKEILTLEDAAEFNPKLKMEGNKLYNEWIKTVPGLAIEIRKKAGGKINFAGHAASKDMKAQFHSETSKKTVEDLAAEHYDTLNGERLDEWAKKNKVDGLSTVIEAYENGQSLKEMQDQLRQEAQEQVQEQNREAINQQINKLDKLILELEGREEEVPFSVASKKTYTERQKIHDAVLAKLGKEVESLQASFAEKKKVGTFTKGFTSATKEIHKILKAAHDYAKANLPKSEHHRIVREMRTLKVVSKWKKKTDPLRRVRAFLENVDRAMDMHERSEAHKELKKTVKQAQKQYKIFSDTPKMYPQFVKQMANILKSVDFAPSKNAKEAEEQARELGNEFDEYLKEDPAFDEVIPDDIKDAWKKLTQSSIRQLETEEIESLTDGLKAVMSNQKNYKQMVHDGHLRERQKVKDGLLETVGEPAEGDIKARPAAKEYTLDLVENMESFLLLLDNNVENGPWQKFFYDQGADAGTTEFIKLKHDITEIFHMALKNNGVKMGRHINEWSATLPGKTDVLNIKTSVGNIKMTPATRIAFALTARDKDGLKGLLNEDGWFVDFFQQGKEKGKTIAQKRKPLTKEAIAEIINSMPAQEKAYAEAIAEINNKVLTKVANQGSIQRMGFNIFNRENHYSLHRHKKDVRTTAQEDSLSRMKANKNVIEGAGIFKERKTRANARLVIKDAFATLNEHINYISAYKAHGTRMRNMKSMLRDSDINEAVSSRYGKGSMEILETLVSRVAGQSVNAGSGLLKTIRSNVAGNILSLNPAVWLAQPLSLPMALYEIDSKYLSAAVADRSKAGRKIVADVTSMENSPQLAARREHGHIGRDVGDYLNANEMQFQVTGKSAWRESLGKPMQFSDSMAIGVIVLAAHKQATAENQGESEATIMREAVKLAEKTVRRTQPTWEAKDRTVLGGSESEAVRTVFMFRSFRDKALNALLRAYRVFSGSNREATDTAKFVGRVAVFGVTTALLNDLRKQIVSGARGFEGDDENIVWRWAKEFFGLFPIVGDAVRVIESSAKGKGFFEKNVFDNIVTSSLHDLFAGVGEAIRYAETKEKDDLWNAIKKTTSGLRIAPAPVGLARGLITEAEGVARHFESKGELKRKKAAKARRTRRRNEKKKRNRK